MINQKPDVQSALFTEEAALGATTKANAGSKRARKSKATTRGLRAPSALGKNFVLDTNVLLHDPGCLQRFADNHICIPVDVLSELDRFKNEQSDRGANARQVHRALNEMFSREGSEVTTGVPTNGGGSVRLVVFDPGASSDVPDRMKEFLRVFPDQSKADHRILGCALMVGESNQSPVSLITKDLNMQLKARALGIHCADYMNDKVEPREVTNYEMAVVDAAATELQCLASSGTLELDESRTRNLAVNQYVLLKAAEKHTLPARFGADGQFHKLQIPDALKIPKAQAIKPLNLGQRCLLDALLNPEISLVTCYGQAGTGKTLMAVAAGLAQVYDREFDGLTISRPVVAMGDTVGFLPGTLDEKMRPWLQPIYDALEVVMRKENKGGPRRKQGRDEPLGNPGQKPYENLVQQGIVEIEALCYIRGRSIPNRFFILDEAQQITPLEAKTIVTRMSQGSKLIMVGDPGQIDNPYVDSRSNGLVYTRKRMRGQPFAAHIALSKGERSDLAEVGAKLL
ncbi:PhoH family protein [Sulfuriroseicoccus oceanibius]|uniref:PhoH family protein n=1 Tax=Sulfuriroseicoccus oceanibius TaxID=2707525 RepID=A0A6B3LDS2_9BACT|nr:PhoH family protein [Sulfuriroseicoccus oceanibius]QQL45224.1 PhoH family protein [Sulfuriroseicoccus oceanibius]